MMVRIYELSPAAYSIQLVQLVQMHGFHGFHFSVNAIL